MEETLDIQGDYIRPAISFRAAGGFGAPLREAVSSKDRQLVIAARSGCQIAFRELWDLYSRRVYRTLLGITKNSDDAEDALQDAFLRAFVALEGFEGRSSFYSWLTRIAINSALGILRRRRSRPEGATNIYIQPEDEDEFKEFIDLAPDPEQSYSTQEKREKLMQAIQNLSPELRIVIQMRLTESCSVKEVASRLSISVAAAKSRLYRARIILGSRTASWYGKKTDRAGSTN
jgi:RNA polymerase sigma-70 factor (ECF subfamily)